MIVVILQMSTSASEHVKQLCNGRPLAPGAGAEGRILGLDLAQVSLRLACPWAMLAHPASSGTTAEEKSKVRVK